MKIPLAGILKDEDGHLVSEAVMELGECNCEFTPDPDDPTDDWHFLRTCESCGKQWFGLHCPHDRIQNACPHCNVQPTPR